jgi:hypothetical protein
MELSIDRHRIEADMKTSVSVDEGGSDPHPKLTTVFFPLDDRVCDFHFVLFEHRSSSFG